jgi:hypothetical protein
VAAMVCFVNIREGVREREYRGSGSERDRMTRMTRHNQKVSTHSINSSHKLQEVNYFAEKSKKGADVFETHLRCSISTQQYIPLVG